jgi:hypothetical protein
MAEQCPASAGLSLRVPGSAASAGRKSEQNDFRPPEAHSGTRDATDDCHAVWFGIIEGLMRA